MVLALTGQQTLEVGDLQGATEQLELAAKKHDEMGLECLKRLKIPRAIDNWIESHRIILKLRKIEREQ